jgi:predicted CoA-substrate-specific enzyme activase
LSTSVDELEEFKRQYMPKKFVPSTFHAGQNVRAFVGIDGGSTSTKGVLLSEDGDVISKAYQLSKGNPIQDTIEIFEELRGQVESAGAWLQVLGVGTTGYAKDVLRDVLAADAALVETVAHTESAVKYYKDPHVIIDVGGQDIKLIVLNEGRVKDFKLNTQCSAGNGYFLQSTAEMFGIPVKEFAEKAFTASAMPMFGYGCAVFMQSDIVNFQRQGWAPEEILAGLAAVLPKNIFLYVASIPNLAKLGSKFVLQGGTQHNLAAVKAEVDFIRSNFRGAEVQPEIIVHEHCGESGAIGAAVEARRLYNNGHRTKFIGLDAVRRITYRTTRNESTRCNFCKNNCLRTFIDVKMGPAPVEAPKPEPVPALVAAPLKFMSKVPKAEDEQRLIIATCEKGTVEDVDSMRGIKAGLDAVKKANPNFMEIMATEVWRARKPARVADPIPTRVWTKAARQRVELMKRRDSFRIGMPRVLNMYVYAPFFSAYFESLGIPGGNLVYSDFTSGELYREGSGRGAIDPCFPAKIGIAHVHNLMFTKHAKKKLDLIFFPMVDVLHTPLNNLQGSNACPTVTVTPETAKAAFTKESNVFAEQGVSYLDPLVNFADRRLLAQQLFDSLAPLLGLSEEENVRAIEVGFAELAAFEDDIRKRARAVMDQLEAEKRIGIVVLARPYHHDPGPESRDPGGVPEARVPGLLAEHAATRRRLLERLFGDEVRNRRDHEPARESRTSGRTATRRARTTSVGGEIHRAPSEPRGARALELQVRPRRADLHDYRVDHRALGTPYFSFKDIDEQHDVWSIKIRVETIHYFLTRYIEPVEPPAAVAGRDRAADGGVRRAVARAASPRARERRAA